MCRNRAPHWQIWSQPFMETKSDKVDYWLRGALAVAGLGLVSSVLLWQKLQYLQVLQATNVLPISPKTVR